MNRFALLRVKGMPWLLIVWGMFNMARPLWKGMQDPFLSQPDSSALFAGGLTAVIAGMILLELATRLVNLERNAPEGDSPDE
jgi:hypothetical protein